MCARAGFFSSIRKNKKKSKVCLCYSKRLVEYQLRHILGPDVLQLNENQFNVHELMNKIKEKTGMRFKMFQCLSAAKIVALFRYCGFCYFFCSIEKKNDSCDGKKMKILIF